MKTYMSLFFFIMFFILLSQSGIGRDCDTASFNEMYRISQKTKVNLKDLKKSRKLVNSGLCSDYMLFPDSNWISTTAVFSSICIKSNRPEGAKFYIEYLNNSRGSAEEQRSFSFEELFSQMPEFVIKEILKQDSATKEYLLGHLIWGFVNNRFYGAVDPYKGDFFKAMTVYDKPKERILDSTNYKKIFFEAHPKATRLKNKHSKILNKIFDRLSVYLKLKSSYRSN